MNNDQIEERLKPSVNHKFDHAKVYALERDKNRVHAAKYKENIRASMKRRMAKPKNQASAKALARVGWLLRHPVFALGKYPPSSKQIKAITLQELLSADAALFREHMGSLFHSGMAWDNYGKMWQVGHRVPVRYFDCANQDQLIACFHYKNLQPELKEENSRRLNELQVRP